MQLYEFVTTGIYDYLLPAYIMFALIVWADLGITGVTNESANNDRPISRKLGIAAFHVLQYFSFFYRVFHDLYITLFGLLVMLPIQL